jgi:thiol-disulfide isomerase/thioredoxin
VIEGPTVVNLFASWCPPCIREMPDFETVSQELAGNVEFIGLAVQDRPEDATRIVEDTGVTYRWARDVKGDFASAASVTQMPSTLLVDADGEIVRVHAGALDADELRELIETELGVAAR